MPYLAQLNLSTEISLADAALLFITLLLALAILKIERRLQRLLTGKKGENLDEIVETIGKELSASKKWREMLENYLETVEKRVRKSIRGVRTIRFNPFKGTGSGGNQSFATAFLNEEGEGVVVSSLYSRDRVSVFAKPLKPDGSEFELTDEEREAIKSAKETL
ncbi:MAG: DUF4446 family protein [Candidatus Taylorbacteria bacterium]|nr:DUF4446 family protein [Candidatus Taylorbacteria bacterium]